MLPQSVIVEDYDHMSMTCIDSILIRLKRIINSLTHSLTVSVVSGHL